MPIQSETPAQCEQSSVLRAQSINPSRASYPVKWLLGATHFNTIVYIDIRRLVKQSIGERRVSRYEELNLSYNFVLTEYIWDPFFKYGHLQFHPNVSRSISDTCCFTKTFQPLY